MGSPLDVDGWLEDFERKLKLFDENHAAPAKLPQIKSEFAKKVLDFETIVASIKEIIEHTHVLGDDQLVDLGVRFRSGPDRNIIAWSKSELDVAERELPAALRTAVQREIGLGFRFDTNSTAPITTQSFNSVPVARQTHAPLISSTPIGMRDRRGVHANNAAAQLKNFPADMSPVITMPAKIAKSHDALNLDFEDGPSNTVRANAAIGISLPDLTDDNALNADGNLRLASEHGQGSDAGFHDYVPPATEMPPTKIISSGPYGDQPQNYIRAGRRSTFSVVPDVSQLVRETEKTVQTAENDAKVSDNPALNANCVNVARTRQSRRTFCVPPVVAAGGLDETFTNEPESNYNQTMAQGDHGGSNITHSTPFNVADSQKTMTFNSYDRPEGLNGVRSAALSSQSSSSADFSEQQDTGSQIVNKFGKVYNVAPSAPQIVKRGGVRAPTILPSRNVSAMPNSVSTNSMNSIGTGSTSSLSSINNPMSPFGVTGLPLTSLESVMPRSALPIPLPSTALRSPRLPPPSNITPPVGDTNRSNLPVRGGLRPPGLIKRT